jgi:hypothetical protein
MKLSSLKERNCSVNPPSNFVSSNGRSNVPKTRIALAFLIGPAALADGRHVSMEMAVFAVYTWTLVRVLVSFLLAQAWAANLLLEQKWHMA